jgi:hypothetical protein
MVFASTDSIIKEAAEGMTMFSEPSSKLEVGRNTGIRINVVNGKMYTFETDEQTTSHMTGGGFPPHGMGMPV